MNQMEFIDILETDEETQSLVRQWRNKDEVRRYMIHQHNISTQEHAQWLEGLKTSTTHKYWVVYRNDEPVGMVYLNDMDPKERTSQWGFYIGEEKSRGKGLGKNILFELLTRFFDEMHYQKLITEVFSQNTIAFNLYHQFMFRRVGQRVLEDSRKLLLLEFTKADWDRDRNRIHEYVR